MEDNIKMDLKEIKWERMELFHPVLGFSQVADYRKHEKDLWVP
jgi:hypothetical protein